VLDIVAEATHTNVAASQPDMLDVPSGAFLQELVGLLQANGLAQLLHHTKKLRRKLPVLVGDVDTSATDKTDDESSD
jgi:hypothetical protein